MSGRALSPSPEEIHDRSGLPRRQRPSISTPSADGVSAEPSPITDVFSDEFSLEPLDSFDVNQDDPVSTRAIHNGQHPSSPSPTAHENGPYSHLSPFRDPVESDEEEMSKPADSPPKSVLNNAVSNAASTSVTRNPSSASSTQAASSVAHRSLSTSSRFSIPRALSPYTGQTGPSHPYAMYPQGIGLGRSPSDSSTSTVRPVERHHIDPMPPQHPYAMYPQNTVPEEEDVDLQQHSPIPVGFPGRDQAFLTQPRQTPDEVGDIVGLDGHAEQLPPYSRYPDGLPQKYGAHEITPTPSQELPAGAPISPDSGVSSRTLLDENGPVPSVVAPEQPRGDDPSGSTKERLSEKGKKRVCCGLQIWTIILIAIVVLIGTVIGGVIGGVLGNQRGEKAGGASASSALVGSRPTSVFVTVTPTTSMLDAAHLTTTPSLLPIPTGSFNIAAKKLAKASNDCVTNESRAESWGCMDMGAIPFELTKNQDGSRSIKLESYKQDGWFLYGPQLPVLEETTFDLELMMDKTSPSLGPALFFFTAFDKLVIVHENDFPPDTLTQPINGDELRRRENPTRKLTSEAGDKPYFCWWNSTYLELFIYVNERVSPTTITGSTYETPQVSTTFKTSATPALDMRDLRTDYETLLRGVSWREPYGRTIKLEEKRSSLDGSPPYCEQMQVMDDGSISGPIRSRIPIGETETTLSSKRDVIPLSLNKRSSKRDHDEDDSKCLCQWIND
ncbi:hypothetical protein FQN52_002658 [Onygenales sp. PD_12]|nr:hypothetical protein FQN52_002658 [Onygenales sp. PD_12]